MLNCSVSVSIRLGGNLDMTVREGLSSLTSFRYENYVATCMSKNSPVVKTGTGCGGREKGAMG